MKSTSTFGRLLRRVLSGKGPQVSKSRRTDWSIKSLEPRLMLAGDLGQQITIVAAGTTGEETMELRIDDQVVQTWENVGGDPGAGQLETFTYQTTGPVSANQIKVAFTNDLYDPDQGIDRNLVVVSMAIDGDVYRSDDPSVFSTGVWLPEDGIQPGYRESNFLAADGYFQYQEPDTTAITIDAAGNENDEIMELWIDDTKVQTWSNIGGNAYNNSFESYTYISDTDVTIDQIRIAFTNDLYVNDGEIDRNLRVDRVSIGEDVYQTEAPTVFSTGTWEPGGVVPGYKQNEFLHSDGSFYFGGEVPPPQPGVISLATSNVTVDETAGFVALDVVRSEGTDGTITVDYATFENSAAEGIDYTPTSGTLTFLDGQSVAQIQIPILDDDLAERAEQFNVTIDNVVGGATLLAPRTATVTIVDDEVLLPNYDDFADSTGLIINGDATINSDELRLTPATNWKAGSAFYETPIDLSNDGSFRSEFGFQITGGSSGADGLTFTIQNDPAGAAAIGSNAGQLGYDGIANSIAVEFDTWKNSPFDISNNHVSIIQGSVQNALKTTVADFDLNGGSRLYAWVDYNGTSDVLAVYLSDQNEKPELAAMKTTVDLETVVGNQAYVGFTGATGGSNNVHRITSWNLDQQDPPQDPPTQVPDTLVAVDQVSGLIAPTAIDWLPGGAMLIAQQGGVVDVAVDGVLQSEPFIDISAIVNGTRDRGLLDIAVHPDFENNPYVYLLFTYDPPEVEGKTGLAGPDGKGNRAGRLIRVTADQTEGYLKAVEGSDVILLGANSTWENFNGFANSTNDFEEPPAGEDEWGNYLQDFIPSDSESHTVGSLAFGIDGMLFVSIGDGASYNRVDPRADRVQHADSLSGKVLRIDPITGEGVAGNPYFEEGVDDPNANRSKVYQMGLRNPFRISVDSETGQLYVGDVGWTKWEEINAAGAGANFGWPFYEGGNGTSLVNNSYANTPEGEAFFAEDIPVDASIYALSHQADGINAIVMGDVYRGDAYGGQFDGDIFFNDLGQGIVRHATINPDGTVGDVNVFDTGANIVVALRQGPDDLMYYVDLDDGTVGRWELV